MKKSVGKSTNSLIQKLRKLRQNSDSKTVTVLSNENVKNIVEKDSIKIENKLSGFGQLGLDQDLVMALEELNFFTPTPVQKAIIPRILSDESIVVAAATGSGKTLAFVLPVLQQLIEQVRFMC